MRCVRMKQHVALVTSSRELGSGEQFPIEYLEAFKSLWTDAAFQTTISRGNEFALQDNFS
jgi:hypothetical protein